MPDRNQERTALALFIGGFQEARCVALAITHDNAADFPDFVLSQEGGEDLWVEVVEAVESGHLLAAERRAQRLYQVAAREHRARGDEVVLTVSPQGIESVTPSPGFGVTGVLVPGPARRISPPEWIAKALKRKGRPDRYGSAERARTTLVIDCSREVLIDVEDVLEARQELNGDTLGFKEAWCVSTNWAPSRAVFLAP